MAYRGADHAMVETAGVGYIVYCSERTLAALPPAGDRVSLWTELVVREDAMTLYGFLTLAEKEWHRLLTSVQGIGSKGALAILGTLGADGTGRAIALGDAGAIRAAPGVGPKTANRVVLELKDKAPSVLALGAEGAASSVPVVDAVAPAMGPSAAPETGVEIGVEMAGARADALSALVNLGYAHGDAAAALAEAEGAAEASLDTGDLIRAALRLLAPKG